MSVMAAHKSFITAASPINIPMMPDLLIENTGKPLKTLVEDKSFRKGSKRKGLHHYSPDCKGTIPLPDFSESSGITDVCSHHVLLH